MTIVLLRIILRVIMIWTFDLHVFFLVLKSKWDIVEYRYENDPFLKKKNTEWKKKKSHQRSSRLVNNHKKTTFVSPQARNTSFLCPLALWCTQRHRLWMSIYCQRAPQCDVHHKLGSNKTIGILLKELSLPLVGSPGQRPFWCYCPRRTLCRSNAIPHSSVAGVAILTKWRSEICGRCWSAPKFLEKFFPLILTESLGDGPGLAYLILILFWSFTFFHLGWISTLLPLGLLSLGLRSLDDFRSFCCMKEFGNGFDGVTFHAY